jgi:hypothetical protein
MAKKTIIPDFVQDDSFRIKIEHSPVADITGAVLLLTLKSTEDAADAALSVSHTVGDDADDSPGTGVAYITVTREDTSAVAAGSYFASVKRTIGTDTVTIARTGKDNGAAVRVYKTLAEVVA